MLTCNDCPFATAAVYGGREGVRIECGHLARTNCSGPFFPASSPMCAAGWYAYKKIDEPRFVGAQIE